MEVKKPYLEGSDYYTKEDIRQFYAVKRNDLIQKQNYKLEKARGQSLSLIEQKTLLYIISKIQPEDTELLEQTFDIKEFCSVCGFSTGGRAYEMLKDTVLKLKSRCMWLTKGEEETTVSWIDKATINRNSGKIRIKLDDDLIPYLLMLKKNYTRIPIYSVVRMKSKYGIALYELLQSYLYLRGVQISIEDLKTYLDCTSYKTFNNFFNKVLTPALRDINTYSNIKCEYELLKTGRAYTHIIFTLTDLSEAELPADKKEWMQRGKNVLFEIEPEQKELYKIIEGGK